MKKLLLAGVALAWAGAGEAARFVEINFSATGRGAFPPSFGNVPDNSWFSVAYNGTAKIFLGTGESGSVCDDAIRYCINITDGRFIDNYLRHYVFTDGFAEFIGVDFRTAAIGASFVAFGGLSLEQYARSGGVPRYVEELSARYTAKLLETTEPFQSTFSVRQIAVSPMVPEPATWAMLILGFGLTGSALRRRRAAVA